MRLAQTLLTLSMAGLLAFSLTLPASAQVLTGSIVGTVVDANSGTHLPGVTVTATRQAGGTRGGATDLNGTYRLAGLIPGQYEVTAELAGFEPSSKAAQVGADKTAEVDFKIGLEAITETLTVTAEAPLIEAQTTELSTTLGGELTELLPIQREATDLVKFTPGGSNSALWGGSTSQANSYKLDGVSVNQPGFGGDFLLPNVDWIEELQVRGLGAGAEYGNFQGGLINIVTKSGGNDVKGSVRLNLEDESMNASNLDTFEAGVEDDRRWEINTSVSGPLQSDRLFYFLSLQRVERERNIVDIENSTPGSVAFLGPQDEREETKALAKLNWQPNDRGLLTGVLGYDLVETANRGLDSFTAPEAAEEQDSPSFFYNLAWSSSVGNATFYELKLTGYDGDDDRLPKNGETPSVRILGGDRETFRNAVFTRLRSPQSTALSSKFDFYFKTGEIEHQLKIGGEYEAGDWFEARRRNGGFTWRPEVGSGPFDANDPSTWGFISSDWGSGIELDAETVNTAL